MSILMNCGAFSEMLLQIRDDKINQMVKAGKKVQKKDYDNIDLELFEAYQNILSMVHDKRLIGLSLDRLKGVIANGSDLASISTIAVETTRQVVKEETNTEINQAGNLETNYENDNLNEEELFEKPEEKSDLAIQTNIPALIPYFTRVKKIDDSSFDPEIKESMKKRLEKAKSGDDASVIEAAEFRVLIQIKEESDLDPDYFKNESNKRHLIRKLRKMKECDIDDATLALIEELAEKTGLDIISTDETGKKHFDSEKFDEQYPEGDLMKKLNDDEHKARKARRLERLYGVSSWDVQSTENGTKHNIRVKAMKDALRKAFLENDQDSITEIVCENPEAAKEIISKDLKYVAAQQRYGSSPRLDTIQKRCLILGDIIKGISAAKDESSVSVEGTIENPESSQAILQNPGNQAQTTGYIDDGER